jgi:type I restriction-modification system, M subunit, putative
MSRDILFVERNLDFLKPGGRMAIVLPQGRFNNSTDKALREYIGDRCRILAVVGLHSNVFKPHTGTKTSVLFLQKWDDKLCPRVEDYNIFFATMQEPSKDNSGDKIYRSKTYVKYFENHQIVEYTLDDFIAKYDSIEKATLWMPQKEYNKEEYQNIINSGSLETMNTLACCIDGKTYNNLSKEEQEEYVNLFMPIVETRPLLDTHGHLIVKHDLFNHEGLTPDGIAEAFIEFAKKEQLSFFVDAPLMK